MENTAKYILMPLTLEQRNELQADEIREKEQQIQAQQQEIDRLKDRNVTYVNENANQAKEIERLNEVLDDWKYNAKCDADHIAGLIADKDEQAGRIMRMEKLLKAARSRLPNIGRLCICGTCKTCGVQIGYASHRYCDNCLGQAIDALLGGKEDAENT